MRDTRPHIKLCYIPRNFTAYTQPLDWVYMRAFKSSIRSEVAKHFAEFFLEAESNFERANLDSSTSVLRQLLLSFLHTAAQNADSPQHRADGWCFIDWKEVEQRELLAEAKRLLETGELFPRGTAEEPHAPDAEAEAKSHWQTTTCAAVRVCCFLVLPFCLLFPCVFTFFASSIACTQNGGQMTKATAIIAVPVLEEVYAGTTRSGACGSICLNTGKLTRF